MGHRKKTRSKRPQAKTADKYALYLQSVQAPEIDVKFFARIFRSSFEREPLILREDFCGTAAICCEWAKLRKDHQAYGVDLDPVPLAWGQEHNLSKLSEEQKKRVHLVEADVRTAKTPRADIVAAQNFSYYLFKTRDELRAYFQAAYKGLKKQGILILDSFGGYEAMEDGREDVTAHDHFDYVWEQAQFDPITADATFHIHFRFKDGSEMKRAFSYDWRFWSLPEIRELVLEAGFERADVYWEDTDSDGEGSGVFRKRDRGECDPAWNAYIIGVKG